MITLHTLQSSCDTQKEKVSSCPYADLLGKASSWSRLLKDKLNQQKHIISWKESFYEMNYELLKVWNL